MTGFSLYETLRIFAPGAFAVLFGDLVLRFSGVGRIPTQATLVNDAIKFLENTATFAVLAVVLGLALYLIDLPTKTRLYREGDPRHGFGLPSRTLAKILANTDLRRKSLGLYFIISDRYLPAETHRRVYLFGSLYRVAVDLRILAVSFFVLGVAWSTWIAESHADLRFPQNRNSTWWGVVLLIAITLIGGLAGIRQHAQNYYRARSRETPPSKSLRFRDELRKDLREILGVVSTLLLLGTFAMLSIVRDWRVPSVIAATATLSVTLWLMVEIGPPSSASWLAWRDRTLFRIGLKDRGPQFAPAQRMLVDLSLFAPWLIVSAAGSNAWDMGIGGVLRWATLLVPPTIVVSMRKHEDRLLQAFADQSLWLELHAAEVAEIGHSGKLPDQWT